MLLSGCVSYGNISWKLMYMLAEGKCIAVYACNLAVKTHKLAAADQAAKLANLNNEEA